MRLIKMFVSLIGITGMLAILGILKQKKKTVVPEKLRLEYLAVCNQLSITLVILPSLVISNVVIV